MSNVDFTLMKKGYIPKIQRGRATLLSKAVLSGRKHSNKQIRLFHYDVEMRSSASPGPSSLVVVASSKDTHRNEDSSRHA